LEEKNAVWNTPYLFNGKELDKETGLNYFSARYQDPKTGIFISVDPLAEHSPNKTPYHYCSNNPINRTDPTGMCDDPNCTHGAIRRGWDAIGRFFGAWGHSESNHPTAKQSNVTAGPIEVIDPQSPEEQEKYRKYNEEQLLPLNKVILAGAILARAWETGIEGLYMKMAAPAELAPLVVNSEANAAKGGWKVGQPITNLTAKGNVPAWSTVRQRFWKNEAFLNGSTYSESNLLRMQKGLAPQRLNPNTGLMESMELHHHIVPQRNGGLFDFMKVWPDEHRALDPFRR
jgi:RHS repeat-associated protein